MNLEKIRNNIGEMIDEVVNHFGNYQLIIDDINGEIIKRNLGEEINKNKDYTINEIVKRIEREEIPYLDEKGINKLVNNYIEYFIEINKTPGAMSLEEEWLDNPRNPGISGLSDNTYISILSYGGPNLIINIDINNKIVYVTTTYDRREIKDYMENIVEVLYFFYNMKYEGYENL